MEQHYRPIISYSVFGGGASQLNRVIFTSMLTATAVLGPAACSSGGNNPVAVTACPTDYIKVGNTCLDKFSQRPGSWRHAYRKCREVGDIVASPETLYTALKEHPSFFEPAEKAFWSARVDLVAHEPAGRAFIVKPAGFTGGERPTRVFSPQRLEASHHFRCEKVSSVGARARTAAYSQTPCWEWPFKFLLDLFVRCAGIKCWPG